MEKITEKVPILSVVDNKSQESGEIDPNVSELKNLISSQEFSVNFLTVQTKEERKNILKIKRRDTDYSKKTAQANHALNVKLAEQKEILNSLMQELDHPAPQLVEALNVWGRSRNIKGETGVAHTGFNAGIIHFFEYRSHHKKSKKRFKPEHTFSIEGFIVYTKQYEKLLKNPNPATNPDIKISRLLEDSKGNHRLYILAQDGDFVVGFQRAGEEMKILSVYLVFYT